MNRLETITILQIRKELKSVCQRMIRAARSHGKGWEYYDTDHPDYKALRPIRDRLADQLRREWNGY